MELIVWITSVRLQANKYHGTQWNSSESTERENRLKKNSFIANFYSPVVSLAETLKNILRSCYIKAKSRYKCVHLLHISLVQWSSSGGGSWWGLLWAGENSLMVKGTGSPGGTSTSQIFVGEVIWPSTDSPGYACRSLKTTSYYKW